VLLGEIGMDIVVYVGIFVYFGLESFLTMTELYTLQGLYIETYVGRNVTRAHEGEREKW
jgi:hypothetical protein